MDAVRLPELGESVEALTAEREDWLGASVLQSLRDSLENRTWMNTWCAIEPWLAIPLRQSLKMRLEESLERLLEAP